MGALFPALVDASFAARLNRISASAASVQRARQTFARQCLQRGYSAEEIAGALCRRAGAGPQRARLIVEMTWETQEPERD